MKNIGKFIQNLFLKLMNIIIIFFRKLENYIVEGAIFIYSLTILKKSYFLITCYFIKKRNSFDRSLGYPLAKNPDGFDDLTPSIIEKDIYINSLYWTLTNSEIKNVALTGSYGSGKSSILKTLKLRHPEFNYLNISLATFEEPKSNDNEKPITKEEISEYKKNKEELNQKVELSILQQMLYLEKGVSLPNSRFKRIRNLKKYSLIIFTIVAFLVALSFIYLFYEELFKNLKIYSSISEANKSIIEIISLAVFISGFLFILKSFIKSLYHFRFEKINIKGEIELNREVDNNSILNKNLDEIIYFFEKTNYNVVLIEDLDRFKEPEIFTKLREINLLLNNSKQVNRHITFIYALKDEMFKDGNRTKFFDFIVPVIPIINPSNSYDLLYEKLKNEQINNQLLDDISLYIDDMRLLKNIVNEFKIYKNKLNIIDLDKNKLLSFIIYKNKYPEDFAKLHYNKGMIYNVFNKDEQKIKGLRIGLIKKENKKIRLRLSEINDLGLKSIEELRKQHILKIIENFPSDQKITTLNFDKKYEYNNVVELITDSAFKYLIKSKSIRYTYQTFNYNNRQWFDSESSLNVSFNDIEEQIGNKYSYEKSELLINENTEESINALKFELFNGENNIKVINSLYLNELIADSSEGLNEDIRNEDILVYFLRNALIDENYWYYISLFHETEGGLSKNDQNYIVGIRNRKPRELNYKLNNIERILMKISDDFDNEIILNLDLVDYLFEKKYNDKIVQLFSLFKSTSTLKFDFIKLYIYKGKNIRLFVKEISNAWSGFWDHIQLDENNTYPIDKKDEVLMILLQDVKLVHVLKQNNKGNLSNYISNKSSFLTLINSIKDDYSKIIKNLIALKVKFLNLLELNDDKSLFTQIYENDLYELNQEMIEYIMKLNGDEIDLLNLSNYSTIQSSKSEFLKKYIESNLTNYISNVFLKIDGNIEENELTIKKLLNSDLEDVIKIKIIEKQNVKISNILDVYNQNWGSLFYLSKCIPSWNNLINYFLEFEFDENLIRFINDLNNSEILSEFKIYDNEFESSFMDEFTKAMLEKDEINENSYSLILKSIDNYVEINLDELNDLKIQKLIENKIIVFNKENFELVKEASYDDIELIFIELNFTEYLKNSDEFDFNLENYKYLLKSEILKIDDKIEIIYELNSSNLSDIELSNAVATILSKNEKTKIDYDFLYELIKNSKETKIKVLLFNKYFDLFKNNLSNLELILTKLGNPYSEIVKKWKEINLSNNEFNLDFIGNLKRIKYANISSDKIEEKNIKIVTRRK